MSYVEDRAAGTVTAEHYERAARLLPRGGTRQYHFTEPTYLERGEGGYVWDVDGRRLIDCVLVFGTMILGHGRPEVTQALNAVAESGGMLGAPGRSELELAEEIARRVSSIERIAFCNSGTEATTAALRMARARTGRPLVAKFEGGYHGWNDHFVFSIRSLSGPVSAPVPVPQGSGLTDAMREQIVVLPYNRREAFDILEQQGDRIAALFVEAVQGAGGATVADRGWLSELRERCRRLGIVFVLDEVVTGFRMGPGGAAETLQLDPDLITYGKIAGGGLPIGVVAGKSDVMDVLAPPPPERGPLLFGTFTANPYTMAAGVAYLRSLEDEDYARLSVLGDQLRDGVRSAIAEIGINARVTGTESMWGVHLFGVDGLTDMRDILMDPDTLRLGTRFAEELRVEGVLVHTPMHIGFLSTAHTEDDVAEIVDAHRRALARIHGEESSAGPS